MVSGTPTSDDVSENFTNMQEIGESLRQEFEARLYTESGDGNTTFFSSIKKYKFKSFEENNVKSIV